MQENKAAVTIEDMVFENRNKEYGAYDLRQKFQKIPYYRFPYFLFRYFLRCSSAFYQGLYEQGSR